MLLTLLVVYEISVNGLVSHKVWLFVPVAEFKVTLGATIRKVKTALSGKLTPVNLTLPLENPAAFTKVLAFVKSPSPSISINSLN
jgi:hypothetical protein